MKIIKVKKKIVIFRNGSYGDALVALPCLKLIQTKNNSSEIFYLSLQNEETKFFKPKNLYNKFGLNFKYKIFKKENFYFLKFIFFFLSNKFNEMHYLKEEPTSFILKNNNKISIKINSLLEFFFFKILQVKKIIGLNSKNFDNKSNQKESLRLINRLYKDKINEENIIKLLNQKNKIKKNTDIILCLGGKFKVKDWGLNNWLNLIKLIIDKNKKQKFIIIGSGKTESQKAKLLKKNFPNNCKLYINESFEKLINTISTSKLYIGHDTANMHLAALLGLKTISIFSSREIKGKWFPIGTNHLNFYKDISCSNCKLTDFCHYDKKCIKSFKPKIIFNNIKKYL